jgi:integrase
MECVRLRVKDIDFARRRLVVRDGEGMEKRVTMLPYSLVTPFEEHLLHAKRLHARGLAQGNGSIYVRFAPERKDRRVGRQRIWQYAFPSARLSKDLCTGHCIAIM